MEFNLVLKKEEKEKKEKEKKENEKEGEHLHLNPEVQCEKNEQGEEWEELGSRESSRSG